MSHVYVAEERAFGRQVVVKVLRDDLTEGASAERFKREIALLAKLQHPHIVPLLSAGEEGGTLYYTMPFVEGESLRQRLDQQGELPIADVMRVLREVAAALAYAHKRGIVHRDIKPDNVLFSDGNALVTDFGIAKALEAARTQGDARGSTISQLGVALGTPAYMAPEQGAADPTVDHRADLYALGCVGYELLTGRPPFEGRATRQLLAAHATEAPTPISARRPNTPAALAGLVMQCLEKSAADRPQTAADVVRTLDVIVTSSRAASTTTGAGMHARGVGRRTRRVAVAGALMVAGIAVGLFAARRWQRSNNTPAAYDGGFSDGAPFGFRGERSLSIAPRGDFVVYSAETPGRISQLRYRSLIDTVERLLPGTDHGFGQQVSPDGRTVAFIRLVPSDSSAAGFRVEVTEIGGGHPRIVGDLRYPVALRWVSPSRFFVLDDDGLAIRWFDPQNGEVGKGVKLDRNCHAPSPLDHGEEVLCTLNRPKLAAVVRPGLPAQRLLRQRANVAGIATAPVIGLHFRVVDDDYIVFLSTEGELRAAHLDRATLQIGRAVTLVSGIRREATQVVGQYDIATNGTLTYAMGDNAAVGRLMVVRPQSSTPQPTALLAEPAAFLEFRLSSDGRRLADIVQRRDGQELRVHDLTDGRSRTWLSAPSVLGVTWSPSGDRLAAKVADDSTSALVIGSPDAVGAPDTMIRGTVHNLAPVPLDWRSDSRLYAAARGIVAVDLRTRPARIDTLRRGGVYFPAISPDGRFFLFGFTSGGSAITTFPTGSGVSRMPEANEALWVSSSIVRFMDNTGVAFYEQRVDSATGRVLGAPRPYFSDPLLVGTIGWYHRPAPNGGMVYVQGPARSTATYLRVVPNWVAKMKQAVDSAEAAPR
jgi:serine/threonine-protein kinase